MILILEDFISDREVEDLINHYKNNKSNASPWYGTSTVTLDEKFSDLGLRINNFVKNFNAKIDWGKIVSWPKDSYQPLHFDDASKQTTLSSIIYLNEGYQGGQTFFEDGTVVSPKIKRALFFDGTKYKHGVNQIQEGERFTLAIWYKSL